MGVKVRGGQEILSALKQYEERLFAEENARPIVREALQPIADAMDQNLEAHRRTGKTIEDVKVRDLPSDVGTVRCEVGLSAVKQSASPWARPALDEEGPGWLGRVAAGFRKKLGSP